MHTSQHGPGQYVSKCNISSCVRLGTFTVVLGELERMLYYDTVKIISEYSKWLPPPFEEAKFVISGDTMWCKIYCVTRFDTH